MTTNEITQLSLVLDLDSGFSAFLGDLKWPVLHVTLDFWVVNFATNETFSVENGVGGVGVIRVLRTVSDSDDIQ